MRPSSLFLGQSEGSKTLCPDVPRRLEGPFTPCLGTTVLIIILMVTVKTVISMMIGLAGMCSHPLCHHGDSNDITVVAVMTDMMKARVY